jgi:hypothetical protein
MKPEAYVQFEGTFMLPLRLAEAIAELVPLKATYESGPGYVYTLAPDQKVSVSMLNKDYVAGMIAQEKMK